MIRPDNATAKGKAMNAVSLLKTSSPSSANVAEQIPALEDVSPEYREVFNLRNSLWDKLSALRDEGFLLAQQAREAGKASRSETPPDPNEAARRERVSRLAGVEPTHDAVRTDAISRRLSENELAIKEVEDALVIVAERLRHAACGASAIICEQVKDRHAELVHAVIKSVIALHAANCEYTAFAEALDSRSVGWGSLNPLFARFAGNPKYPQSALRRFLGEALSEGWIRSSDLLPSHLR